MIVGDFSLVLFYHVTRVLNVAPHILANSCRSASFNCVNHGTLCIDISV
jgi:hypothetical protein